MFDKQSHRIPHNVIMNGPIVSNNGNGDNNDNGVDDIVSNTDNDIVRQLNMKRGRFGKSEDKCLRELCGAYPEHEQDWIQITYDFAKETRFRRTTKSLKQRWLNHLSLKPKSYSERDSKNHDENNCNDDEDSDIEILNDQKHEEHKKDNCGNYYWCSNDIQILTKLRDENKSLSWVDITDLYQGHPNVHIRDRSQSSLGN